MELSPPTTSLLIQMPPYSAGKLVKCDYLDARVKSGLTVSHLEVVHSMAYTGPSSARTFIFGDGTLIPTVVHGVRSSATVRRDTPSDDGERSGENMRIMQRLIPQIPQGEAAVSRLVEDRRKCFRETRDRLGVAPMPGALALIEYANRKGIAIGLATSSFREDAHAVLEALSLRYIFNAVVTADDVVRPKPDPEIYLKTALWLSRLRSASCSRTARRDCRARSTDARLFVWDRRFHARRRGHAYSRSFEDYFA